MDTTQNTIIDIDKSITIEEPIGKIQRKRWTEAVRDFKWVRATKYYADGRAVTRLSHYIAHDPRNSVSPEQDAIWQRHAILYVSEYPTLTAKNIAKATARLKDLTQTCKAAFPRFDDEY